MADIHPKTAWDLARKGKIRSRRTGKLWAVSLKDAQEWIAVRAREAGSIAPDAIAKQIGCSGAYVRAQLEKNKFPFALKQSNRRWHITDCVSLREWIQSETRFFSRRKKLALKRGADSGIQNYHGILASWNRWEKRAGGEAAILSWPIHRQKALLEELIPIRKLLYALLAPQRQPDQR